MILLPSIRHDTRYYFQGTMPDGTIYTREQADSELVEGMEECGANAIQRGAVYEAVHLFGGSHWTAKAALVAKLAAIRGAP